MSKPRILMFSMALILSAMGCMFTMVGGSQREPFSTQAWLDSSICSTDWYPSRLDSQDWTAIIGERITQLDLDMELLIINTAESLYGPCGQTYPPQIHAIEMRIIVPSDVIQDDEAIGYRVRQLILLLEPDYDDLEFRGHSLLTIYFSTAEYEYQRWSFPYSQALLALEAGLSDSELFALGD